MAAARGPPRPSLTPGGPPARSERWSGERSLVSPSGQVGREQLPAALLVAHVLPSPMSWRPLALDPRWKKSWCCARPAAGGARSALRVGVRLEVSRRGQRHDDTEFVRQNARAATEHVPAARALRRARRRGRWSGGRHPRLVPGTRRHCARRYDRGVDGRVQPSAPGAHHHDGGGHRHRQPTADHDRLLHRRSNTTEHHHDAGTKLLRQPAATVITSPRCDSADRRAAARASYRNRQLDVADPQESVAGAPLPRRAAENLGNLWMPRKRSSANHRPRSPSVLGMDLPKMLAWRSSLYLHGENADTAACRAQHKRRRCW